MAFLAEKDWIGEARLVVLNRGHPPGRADHGAEINTSAGSARQGAHMKSGTCLLVAITSLFFGNGARGQGCTDDLNGDGIVDAADLARILSGWGTTYPAVIDSITPSLGGSEGGMAITITGSHLAGTTAVTIGGASAVNVIAESPTRVTAVVPPGRPGSADVAVTTPAGTTVISGGFVYSGSGSLPWAVTLEQTPDPAVITNPELREAIVALGLPWRVRDYASQIELVLVPPGTFMMGCSPSSDQPCSSDENPVHEITLTQPFYLGRYEVTQGEWIAVMGSNPSSHSSFKDFEVRPVEGVSWNAIQQFESATGLRLPTEAEWEYACRAGTSTAYHNGSNDSETLGELGWFAGNSPGWPEPVGGKLANAFGCHDMHGNVMEWVEDRYAVDYYLASPSVDPQGPASGDFRVLRGGWWAHGSNACRASWRYDRYPGDAGSDTFSHGFRVARNP